MKVNSLNNRDTSFNGFYNSKALKNTLAFAEKNGALFLSGTSLVLSAFVRPVSILAAPKTDKENKKIACAKSIASTILDFGITLAISIPIVGAMSAITKNPQKYLNSSTINNLKENAKSLEESKAFTLANQLFKLGVGLIIAAPKAILNVTGIPYIMNTVFQKSPEEASKQPIELTFKGKNENKIAKVIGKIIDKKPVQEFSKKNKDSNYPMHITALKDSLTTGVFALGVSNSNKIDTSRKGALIYNSIVSTVLSILSAYGIDSLTSGLDKKFISKIQKANPNDINLKKYIDGYKIAKPAIIMGLIYYMIIPLFSTFIAERIDKKAPIMGNQD